MNKQRLKIILGAGFLVLGVSLTAYFFLSGSTSPAWSPGDILENGMEADHLDGQEYKIMDSSNNLISKMSRCVTVGDELITAGGRHYKINRVQGFNARAEFFGMDRELLGYMDEFDNITVPVAGQSNSNNKPVALYHTHSAESYVPSDGTESIPYEGGIYDVGDSMAAALEEKGVSVLHDKTPHEPRDKNAYYRSRRTAAALLKKNPAVLIDVHRDGIPDPSYYSKTIDGQDVTQLRLVVGRQNPKMESNMEFAKKAMAYANKVHPDLVKEIFIAKGNYNQDLTSTAMLIEVGTHTNTKEAAQKGAAMFAGALPGLLGLGGGTGGADGGTGSGGGTPASWKTLVWIIGISVLGGGAFLLISSGSWENARKRLRGYFGREFAGFMAPVQKRITGNKYISGKKQFTGTEEEKLYSEDAGDKPEDNRDNVRSD